MKAGATPVQATAELKPLGERWAKDRPQTSAGRGLRVVSLQDSTMDEAGRFYVWMLFGLSAFILLIACANLANLQLARATANAKNLAVRSALGASRARLIFHQLTESLMLSFAGGVLGVLVAAWINNILGKSIRLGSHMGLDLPLNAPVLAMATVVSLFAGIVFGLLPAWFASRTDIVTILKQQSRGTTSGHHVMRSLLIVFQVAMGLTLLAGASVMISGFNSFLTRDNGWDTAKIYSASIQLPEQSGSYDTKDKRRLAIDRLTQSLTRLTGAEATTVCSRTPLFGYAGGRNISLAGQATDDPSKLPSAGYILVGSDFFKTLGIPLIEGRFFSPDIRADSPHQIVVGQTLARQFWPNESAIGKQIGEHMGDTIVWCQIIGIVRDIDFPANMRRPDTMLQYYKPLVHEPSGSLNLIARGSSPAMFAKEVRKLVADFDPDMAVLDSFTIPEAIDRYQHNMLLMGKIMFWFALLGLVLASVGLYGVISNVVAQRTGEFGIRLALGATPANVLRLVLHQGIKLTLIGLVIGLGLAIALNTMLGQFMPRVIRNDPFTLLGTAAALFGVALLACYIPARRATKVNPLDALRAE
jgi:predicted permease